MKNLLLVVGAVAAMSTAVNAAVDLKIDFGRTGQPASTIQAGYSEYATDRLNPTSAGPYSQVIAGHTVTLAGREDSGATQGPPFFTPVTPGFRSDNRSAAVVPVAEVALYQDVVRLQGSRELGVDVGNASGRIPVIMFTINNLDANTAYNVTAGGFDGGVTAATYTYTLQATAGSGTTGASTSYGFVLGPTGSIFGGSNPAANSIWTGSTVFTSDANGVLSFEAVLDLANSVGGDDLTFISMLEVSSIPEPASLGLLAVGSVMMLVRRRQA